MTNYKTKPLQLLLHMNRIKHILIICIALILVSCSSNNKRKSTLRQVNVLAANDITDIISDSEYLKSSKAIDFFGVQMLGKYDDIVDKIYALPMLSLIERRDKMDNEHNDVMSFSHTVKFCGVPCGMNARCRMNEANEMSIHDLCFITSLTDNEIIHKFVSELTKYYGEPDIADNIEDSYHWHLPSDLCIRARHLHAPEGGWTVFFYY